MSESIPPDLATGARIQLLRERRGMSRPVLAGLVGRGSSWLKKIERGERELKSYELLSRLATALSINDLSLLTGGTSPVPVSTAGRVMVPFVAEIRDAVRGQLWAPDTTDDLPSIDVLRGRVGEAWRLWHTSRFQRTEVGALLPGLLADAHRLTRSLEGSERRQASVVLADAYRLAQQATAYGCEPELYWTIADRGRQASQDADEPVSLAGAAWSYANGLRETGYADEALRAVNEAVDMLRPRLENGSNDLRGMYGALNLHAAITHAREGRDGDAWRYWDEANTVAGQLPKDYAHSWTVFSQGNTDFHAVSVGVDLRTPGAALQRAESIDLKKVPSVERRARVLVEFARAYDHREDKSGALHFMNRACESSPETVRYTPSARSLVAELATTTRGPLKAEAMALAESVGVPM